jgi:hypothetical protein
LAQMRADEDLHRFDRVLEFIMLELMTRVSIHNLSFLLHLLHLNNPMEGRSIESVAQENIENL